MKYSLYSIRDLKVGYSIPQADQNDATAMRGFAFAVNNEESIMNFEPKDYQLFKIGEFDVDTGKLKPITPVLICEGLDVFGVE